MLVRENLSSGFSTRSETNRAEPQKRDYTSHVAKIKMLITCGVTAQLVITEAYDFTKIISAW